MTEIDWTKPNREADAWIAEHVMGWARHKDKHGLIRMSRPGESWAMFDQFLYYTRDITAVWEVVQELGRKGYWCQIRTPFGDDDNGYWCGFTPHLTSGWNGTPDHWVTEATLPLAICHSAYLLQEELIWEAQQGAPE